MLSATPRRSQPIPYAIVAAIPPMATVSIPDRILLALTTLALNIPIAKNVVAVAIALQRNGLDIPSLTTKLMMNGVIGTNHANMNVINVMGDAAFGMSGLDIETASRLEIPILTIVLNNGVILCDDYDLTYAPGVKKAIDEYVLLNDFNLKILNSRFAEITKNST